MTVSFKRHRTPHLYEKRPPAPVPGFIVSIYLLDPRREFYHRSAVSAFENVQSAAIIIYGGGGGVFVFPQINQDGLWQDEQQDAVSLLWWTGGYTNTVVKQKVL